MVAVVVVAVKEWWDRPQSLWLLMRLAFSIPQDLYLFKLARSSNHSECGGVAWPTQLQIILKQSIETK